MNQVKFVLIEKGSNTPRDSADSHGELADIRERIYEADKIMNARHGSLWPIREFQVWRCELVEGDNER